MKVNRKQRNKKKKLILVTGLLFCMVFFLLPAIYNKVEKNTALPAFASVFEEELLQSSAIIGAETVEEDDIRYLMLVNKNHSLAEDYVPDDLVTVSKNAASASGMQMSAEPAAALEQLSAAAAAEGYTIKLVSGYRSYSLQERIFKKNVAKSGRQEAETYSAPPGCSEHQSGLAADVSSPSVGYKLLQSYGDTEEGIWLAENAHKFGFIIRYQQDTQDITGYIYEPWHIRYVGQPYAEQIYQQNLTLEEFLNAM